MEYKKYTQNTKEFVRKYVKKRDQRREYDRFNALPGNVTKASILLYLYFRETRKNGRN